MSRASPPGSKALEHLYVRFASALLHCMGTRATIEGLPTYGRQRLEFTDTGTSILTIQEPFYLPLAHRCLSASADLVAMLDQCAREHWEAGIFQSPPVPRVPGSREMCTSFDQATSQIDGALLQPILEAVKRASSFAVRSADVLAEYRQARASWASPFNRQLRTVPLLNFECDITRTTPIGTSFQLSPFTPQEKTAAYAVYEHAGAGFGVSLHEEISLTNARYKLSSVVEQEKGSRTFEDVMATFTQEAGEIGDIVTALRLLKSGPVAAPLLLEVGDGKLPWSAFSTGRGVGSHAWSDGSTYSLAAQNLRDVNRLYRSLRELNTKKEPRGGLEVALRYFNQSYTRRTLEDRLVDLAIVVESSLLHGERDELSFRAALLGTALLSNNKKRSRKDTFDLIRLLYEVRSGIVHNGKTLAEFAKKLGSDDPKAFCDKCEDVVRDVLRAYTSRLAKVKQNTYSVNSVNAEVRDFIIDHIRRP